MGQKTNPIGFRIAVTKDWRSKWYSDKKDFGKLLAEDRKIRDQGSDNWQVAKKTSGGLPARRNGQAEADREDLDDQSVGGCFH